MAAARDELAAGEDLSRTDGYDRIWLYFSGGGLGSALGSLGVVYLLTQPWAGPRAWDKVTRITSVSGGSLESAALLGATQDMPTHLWRTFARFTGVGPVGAYRRTLAVGAASLVSLGALVAVAPLLPVPDGFLVRQPVVVAWVVAFLLLVLTIVQFVMTTYARDRIAWMIAPDGKSRTQPGHGRASACAGHGGHAQRDADLRDDASPAGLGRCAAGGGARCTRRHGSSPLLLRGRDLRALGRFRVRRVAVSGPARAGRSAVARAEDVSRPLGRGFALRASGSPGPRGEVQSFVLMDGGLAGTLGSRLDPALFGAPGSGVMELVDLAGDAGDDDARIRRIVVDGGQYLSVSRLWWLAAIPAVSAFRTTLRALKITLDNQITADRAMVQLQDDIWYVGGVVDGEPISRSGALDGAGRGSERPAEPGDGELDGPSWMFGVVAPPELVDDDVVGEDAPRRARICLGWLRRTPIGSPSTLTSTGPSSRMSILDCTSATFGGGDGREPDVCLMETACCRSRNPGG